MVTNRRYLSVRVPVPVPCLPPACCRAEIVIVCEPEGTSLQMGGLHPRASLYEKVSKVKTAHG